MVSRRLSREEFATALQRGQGRAFLHVRRYGLNEVSDQVLEACLHNQAYDPQCENSRAKWLLDMFHDTAEYARFSAAILAALAIEMETWDLQQLCELAALMVIRGDERAHSALRSRVLGQAVGSDDSWVGAGELVKVDGVAAVVELARCYGKRLIEDSEAYPPPLEMLYYYDDASNDVPIAARDRLWELSKVDPEIGVYWDHVLRYEAERTKDINSKNKIRERTRQELQLPQILADATAEAGKHPAMYRRFGKSATPDELEIVFRRLMEEPNEQVCARLLWVFRGTAIPRLHSRLWAFAESPNQDLRSAAIVALSQLQDPLIGEFARKKLRNSDFDEKNLEILDLFIRNYQEDDGSLIGFSLQKINLGSDDAHRIGSSILRILDENDAPDLFEALNWVYEHCPCTICRQSLVEHMIKLDKIQLEVMEECLYDANEDLRKIALDLQK